MPRPGLPQDGLPAGLAPARFARMEAIAAATALLSAAVFAIAAWITGGDQAMAALRAVPLSVLPGMLALSCANYLFRLLRWAMFARALGIDLPLRRHGMYYLAGFALTTTPGKLGEAVRIWLLARGHGYRFRDTAALMIADRLSDAQAMAVVAGLCAGSLAAYLPVTLAAAAIVAAMSVVFLHPSWLLRLVGVGYSITGVAPRLFVGLRRLVRPLARLARGRVLALSLALGICGWFSEGFSLHLVLDAMGVTLPISTAVFIFGFAMIVGALSFLPGGLGSTEATMIGLLTLAHVPAADALVATAIVRATTLWFAVGIGMIALPLALRASTPPAGASPS